MYNNGDSIHLSNEECLNRKENTESVKGPVELSNLPCVVQVQGCQPAVVGQLEGQEDDRVQVQLEDCEPVDREAATKARGFEAGESNSQVWATLDERDDPVGEAT